VLAAALARYVEGRIGLSRRAARPILDGADGLRPPAHLREDGHVEPAVESSERT
jgi:hypothetical protein